MEDEIYSIIQQCIAKYNSHFPDKQFNEMVFLKLTLKGHSAGTAQYQHSTKEYTMNINKAVAENNQGSLYDTVVHEMSHLLSWHQYSTLDHGPDWRWMMSLMGVADIQRCHSLKTTSARKTRKFVYRCDCKTHKLSTAVHNKMQKGWQTRSCKSCRGKLIYTGKEA